MFWGEGGAFCAGWDLKAVSDLDPNDPLGAIDFPSDGGKPPRGPLGPSRLQLSKPVIAAVEGPAVAGGMGKALEIIMTGRKIPAEEADRIGLCERVAPHGKARDVAELMVQEIARFPQECMRSDHRSVYSAWAKPVREGLEIE